MCALNSCIAPAKKSAEIFLRLLTIHYGYEILSLDTTKARRPPENERRAPESPHSRRSKRMATVHPLRTPVKHYAHLGDVEGMATLVNGTGYLFRATGERTQRLVTYSDPELVLHGLYTPETDDTPLWQQLADPAYYNGTCRRGDLVRGR